MLHRYVTSRATGTLTLKCVCRHASLSSYIMHARSISKTALVHCRCVEWLVLISYVSMQINGIALDNKSVTECEALLRNCRDSLSLSLMKVSLSCVPHIVVLWL